MKRSALALLALVALVSLPALAAQDAKIEKGRKVYADQKCSLCHAIQGKGNVKGALDGVGAKLSAAEIKEWIVDPKTMAAKTKTERKPPMKAYATLPADEIEALVAYMQSLKSK